MSYILQPKYEKPKEDRTDHYRPQGEGFDKAYTYDYKSRTDDTVTSDQKVTSEKITISRRDVTHIEETEKPTRYPKDFDIGRIVIEETPEENKELTKRDVHKTDKMKTKHEDTKTYQVRRDPKPQVKEDVVKVGRLDITDYEKISRDSERVEERTTYTERLGNLQRVT